MTEQAQPQDGVAQAESTPAEVPVTEATVTEATVSGAQASESQLTPSSDTTALPDPAIAPEPALGPARSSPFPPPLAGVAAALPTDRPEVAIGGAFAAGLVLGLILKRLAR